MGNNCYSSGIPYDQTTLFREYCSEKGSFADVNGSLNFEGNILMQL